MGFEPGQLPHEIWEDSWADLDGSWHTQPGVCLAGPFGDWFRRALSPRAKLLATFDAGSPSEALAFVKTFLGRGEETRKDRSFQNSFAPELENGIFCPVERARGNEPYPDWMYEDEDEGQAPRADPTHPLWDFELDR